MQSQYMQDVKTHGCLKGSQHQLEQMKNSVLMNQTCQLGQIELMDRKNSQNTYNKNLYKNKLNRTFTY